MSIDLEKLRYMQMRAAEDAVIASIPEELRRTLDEAQKRHEKEGGCKGCGHKVLACHYPGCPTAADDLY